MSWFWQLINRVRARYNDEVVTATIMVQLLVEEEKSKPRRGGSMIGRQVVPRDRQTILSPNLFMMMISFVVGAWL
jgi:hypothetical protein